MFVCAGLYNKHNCYIHNNVCLCRFIQQRKFLFILLCLSVKVNIIKTIITYGGERKPVLYMI